MKRVWTFVFKGLASGAYLSYLPERLFRNHKFTGAGLVGSAWGILALPLLPTNAPRAFCVLLGAACIAVVVSDVAEKAIGRVDDPRIVIDEFVGVWASVAF